MKKTTYITTPIYYASGDPHIGHAFTTIYGDVLARYKRLVGNDAFYQTGMDEHGQKIEDVAKENGVDVKTFVESISNKFKDLWNKLDIHCDSFIRTSEPRHVELVQNVFQEYQDKGYIYLGTWEGLYCVKCEENYTMSRAHVCENKKLLCELGHELTTKKEPSFFFKMSEFTSWIKEYYVGHPNFITPQNRMNELTNSFIVDGVQDLSVSRTSIKWGIPVLSNPNHVVYVWVDALLNYLTGLGYKQKDDTLFRKYWESDNAEIIHIMSKEITRFHCIYWPIMLKCLNLKQPTQVLSHGWIVTKTGKMSKSLGNVVNPHEYIDEFGSDALRYFLMKEISIDSDGIFDRDLFIECFNADLANNYGNLVSRFIGMLKKYSNGTVKKGTSELSQSTLDLIDQMQQLIDTVETTVSSCRINELINNIIVFTKVVNKYIEDTKPWILFQDKHLEELDNFLFYTANAVRTIVTLLQPLLTKGGLKMIKQLKLLPAHTNYFTLKDFDLMNNHKVGDSIPIYARLINVK